MNSIKLLEICKASVCKFVNQKNGSKYCFFDGNTTIKACGLLIRTNQRYLTIKYKLIQPIGGKIEASDISPYHTILRELAEETGFIPTDETKFLELLSIHCLHVYVDIGGYLLLVVDIEKLELNYVFTAIENDAVIYQTTSKHSLNNTILKCFFGSFNWGNVLFFTSDAFKRNFPAELILIKI